MCSFLKKTTLTRRRGKIRGYDVIPKFPASTVEIVIAMNTVSQKGRLFVAMP